MKLPKNLFGGVRKEVSGRTHSPRYNFSKPMCTNPPMIEKSREWKQLPLTKDLIMSTKYIRKIQHLPSWV
jgi:hypothetical protein